MHTFKKDMGNDVLNQSTLILPFLAALLLGFVSPAVGMFLVVRRFSLLADTLAHVSLLGVALAMLWHLPLSAGALGMAILGGLGIETLRQSRRILSEASLALFLSGSLAMALILFAIQRVNGDEIESLLFGNLASVTQSDLALLLLIALSLVVFFWFSFGKLFLISIDEELARVAGIRTNLLNLFFIFLASAVISVAIKVVGVLLVSALIVIPVLAAIQWHLGFQKTLLLSLGLSEFSVGLGFFLAFYLKFPSGPTIALIALFTFIFSYFWHIKEKKRIFHLSLK